tara:strand:- start:381 stop:734 length:354 start_codon:yes stop_codon:yes gene_type:complete
MLQNNKINNNTNHNADKDKHVDTNIHKLENNEYKQDNKNKQSKKKLKSNKKKRCYVKHCNKKLSYIDKQMACVCSHAFCSTHRPIMEHKCTANHKALHQQYLIKNNPIVIPSKLNVV